MSEELLTKEEQFRPADGINWGFFNAYIDPRGFVSLEDELHFFRLDVSEARALRDWLNKVIP